MAKEEQAAKKEAPKIVNAPQAVSTNQAVSVSTVYEVIDSSRIDCGRVVDGDVTASVTFVKGKSYVSVRGEAAKKLVADGVIKPVA